MPERIQPGDRASWRAWLAVNHDRQEGVWLILLKKGTGKQTYTFADATEEALCFGWIDSKPAKLDDERSMLWFAPRKSGSGWSRRNKQMIKKMEEAGLMMPAGQVKIAAAKQDGSWTLLDAIENLEIPPDLDGAFERYPGSKEHFMAFPRSVKRGILEWIIQARRTDTRERRIEETAQKAQQNIRANQWR